MLLTYVVVATAIVIAAFAGGAFWSAARQGGADAPAWGIATVVAGVPAAALFALVVAVG